MSKMITKTLESICCFFILYCILENVKNKTKTVNICHGVQIFIFVCVLVSVCDVQIFIFVCVRACACVCKRCQYTCVNREKTTWECQYGIETGFVWQWDLKNNVEWKRVGTRLQEMFYCHKTFWQSCLPRWVGFAKNILCQLKSLLFSF